jgi:hypothetical protein
MAFVHANSLSDVAEIKRRIDQERHDAEVLSHGGLTSVAGLVAASVLDPLTWIPLGWEAKGAQAVRLGLTLARGARVAGRAERLLVAGGKVIGAAGEDMVKAAGQETALNLTQQTRTLEDSEQNVALAGLASVGFSGAKAVVGRVRGAGRARAGGAAEAAEEAAGEAAAPPPSAVREALVDGPAAGSPARAQASAEAAAKRWRAPMDGGVEAIQQGFVAHRLAVAEEGVQVGLPWRDFNAEVADGLRGRATQTAPEAAEAAKAVRARVLDPLEKDAVRTRVLPRAGTGVMTRLYDQAAVAADPDGFAHGVVEPWLERRLALAEEQAAHDLPAGRGGGDAPPRPTPEQVREAARDLTASVLAQPPGRVVWEVPAEAVERQPEGLKRALADRLFDPSEASVAPWVSHDAEQVVRASVRTFAPEVELARRFGRADLKRQIEALGAQGAHDEAAAVAAARDRVRGVDRLPERPEGLAEAEPKTLLRDGVREWVREWPHERVDDAAKELLKAGLEPLMEAEAPALDAWVDAHPVEADDAALGAAALQAALADQASRFADPWEDFGRHGEALDAAPHGDYGAPSLSGLWDASVRQAVGAMVQNRMLAAIAGLVAGKAVGEAAASALAERGIDEALVRRIAGEAADHAHASGGLTWARTRLWGDRAAARAFARALGRETEIEADTARPTWFSPALAERLDRYRAFAFRTMNQAVGDLPSRDARLLQSFVAAAAMGMLARSLAGGARGLAAGIDASGARAFFAEPDNLAAKGSGRRVDLDGLPPELRTRLPGRNLAHVRALFQKLDAERRAVRTQAGDEPRAPVETQPEEAAQD